MRISQKQADLLAEEIVSRIKKEYGDAYVSSETITAVKQFKAKQATLQKKVDSANKEKDEHARTLSEVVGKANVSKIRGYYDADDIINKLREAASPGIAAVADKIILKSMFATPETMEEFVSGLVKEFKPKAAKVAR